MRHKAKHCLKRIGLVCALAALWLTPSGQAQNEPHILFVGNSFTFGATSAVRHYEAATVHDLNGTAIGGVPALFRRMSEEAGLSYDVSLETIGGADLAKHWREKRPLIDRHWDIVVLQSYSILDSRAPGDPASLVAAVRIIAEALRQHNPHVAIYLTATWPRADLVYAKPSPWLGKPIEVMTTDIAKGYDEARIAAEHATVLPVGEAFLHAMREGVADSDPYDGIAYNKVDLWGWDHYHASTHGYYLEALVAFGAITGRDPRELGAGEKCADDLGLSPEQAAALQRIAAETLWREANHLTPMTLHEGRTLPPVAAGEHEGTRNMAPAHP